MNKLWAIAGAFVLVGVLMGYGVGNWQAQEATEQAYADGMAYQQSITPSSTTPTVGVPASLDIDFDVMNIDPETIRIGRIGDQYTDVAALRWEYEDVATPYICEDCTDCDDRYNCHEENSDGFMDISLKFDTAEIVTNLLFDVEEGDVLCLYIIGCTLDGQEFCGQDVIWIR